MLDPGWTNYGKTCLYAAYDITDRLAPGRHALGVMLGNGMYNVTGGRYVKFTGSFGPPKMILRLEIEQGDGTSSAVVSDGSWHGSGSDRLLVYLWRRGLRRPPGTAGVGPPRIQRLGLVAAPACRWPGGVLRPQQATPIKIIEGFRPGRTASRGRGSSSMTWGGTSPVGRG